MSEERTFGIERKMGGNQVSTMHAKRLILSLTAVLFLVLGLVPLISLFTSSLMVNGALSLDSYRGFWWTSPRPQQLFGRSLLLAELSTLGATLLSLPLGILFAKL